MLAAFMAFIVEVVKFALTSIKLVDIMTFKRNTRIALVHFDREFILNMLNG